MGKLHIVKRLREAAVKAGVLEMSLLEQVKEPMQAIKPMKAVFDRDFVKRINGPNVMTGGSKMDYAQRIMDDLWAIGARAILVTDIRACRL